MTDLIENIIRKGDHYKDEKNYYKALKLYFKALNKSEQKNSDQISIVLNKLGHILYDLKYFEDSLEYFKRLYKSLDNRSDYTRILNVLFIMGNVFRFLSDFDSALENNKKALEISLKERDSFYINKAIHQIGIIFLDKKKFILAKIYLNKSLLLALKIGHTDARIHTLNSLSSLYDYLEDFDLSMKFRNQILNIIGNSDDHPLIGTIIHNNGYVYYKKRQYHKAIGCFRKAIPYRRKNNNIEGFFRTLTMLGIVYNSMKLHDLAEYYLKEAMKVFMLISKKLKTEKMRIHTKESLLYPFEHLVDLYLDKYRLTKNQYFLFQALKYLEYSKAREIYRKVKNKKSKKINFTLQKKKELKDWYKIAKLFESYSLSIQKGTNLKDQQNSQKKDNELNDKYNKLINKLVRAEFRSLESFIKKNLIKSKSKFNKILAKEKLVVWEFFYLNKLDTSKVKFQIICFKSSGIEVFESKEFNREFVLDYMNEFQKELKVYQNLIQIMVDINLNSPLNKLTNYIIETMPNDALNGLTNKNKLIIIPHNFLFDFPWEAIEEISLKLPISRSLSLELLIMGIKKPRRKKVKKALIISNPNFNIENLNLRSTQLELAEIKSVFKKRKINLQILNNNDATISNFLKSITKRRDIIHFTGHAIYNPKKNLIDSSGLLFYKSAGIELFSIKNFKMMKVYKNPIFILNACETGKNRISKIDELIGIIGSLTSLDISCLIATNWAIFENPGLIFIKELYNQLFCGKDVGESVFMARKYLKISNFEDPLYWGAFTLYGNPLICIK